MRHLMRRRRGARRQRGFTLVELMAGLAIAAILYGMGAPYLKDFISNARLRDAGNALLAEALFAQGEAIKRNGPIRLVVDGGLIQVRDMSNGGVGVLVRNRQLADGLGAVEATAVDFSSRGTPLPFGTAAAIDLVKSGLSCSADFRCPGLRIDGGGGIRLCANHLSCA